MKNKLQQQNGYVLLFVLFFLSCTLLCSSVLVLNLSHQIQASSESVEKEQSRLLANSGCLNNCSSHNFHDNLVAHEDEISKMDNAYNFGGICKEFLKNPNNYEKLVDRTNFIRPEDIHLYEGYFVAAKLATRVHSNPNIVLKSYINQKYSGDILRLLEPAHSIYPYVLENGNPLKLKKLI